MTPKRVFFVAVCLIICLPFNPRNQTVDRATDRVSEPSEMIQLGMTRQEVERVLQEEDSMSIWGILTDSYYTNSKLWITYDYDAETKKETVTNILQWAE
jgi:hypothetical protein